MKFLELPNADTPQPFDRSKLVWPVKVFLWIVEYIVRIIAMASMGVVLLIVGFWPPRSATRKVFRLMGMLSYEFELRILKKDKEATIENVPKHYKPVISKDRRKGNNRQQAKPQSGRGEIQKGRFVYGADNKPKGPRCKRGIEKGVK